MVKPFPLDPDYLISDTGQVFSTKHGGQMNVKYNRGYAQIGLRHGEKQITYQVNRLVLMTFVRLPNKGEHAHHKNNIKHDNRLENLEWVTCAENQKLKEEFGTAACDERHGMSTISNAQVKDIRFLCCLGLPEPLIAKKHGISRSQVNKISRRIQRKKADV